MADTIFFGGDIITVNDAVPMVEALAVSDGIISALGPLTSLEKLKTPRTRLIDLNGRTMLPGFIEPHTHPISTAVHWNDWTDISGFKHKTRESVMSCLREQAKTLPEGEWIKGYGWDVVLAPDMIAPTRQELDEISSKHPIYLFTQTGHTAFCNSLAFKMAKVDEKTTVPFGGQFMKDKYGRLNGTIKELTATNKMYAALPRIQRSKGALLIKTQLNDYGRHGFTTIAATGLFRVFPTAYDIIYELCSSPTTPVNLVVYHVERVMEVLHSDKYPDTPGAQYPCHIGVKFWADGSPYSATMATKEPYLESEMTLDKIGMPFCPCYGHLNYNFENLINRMRPYHKKGYQLAVHAHGERAIGQVMDVYEALLKESPRSDHRYRLEHCGLMTKEQMYRAKELGVTVSFFPDHIHYWGKALKSEIIGPERTARFVAMNTAKTVGLRWTVHSDSPCTPLGPFRVMQTCVTRCCRQGETPEMLGPEERVTVDDIIKAYTIEAAWQIFHEDLLGSLEVGKVADLLIVDKNPRKVDPDDLHNIQVVETYRQGRKVNLSNEHRL